MNKQINKHPNISIDREMLAIQKYRELKNMAKTAKEIHMGEKTLRDILVKNNIHILSLSEVKQTRTIDNTYFENIDSARKAYYLGLLYADGTVSSNGNSFQISLQERDKHLLEQFQKDLNSNHKLVFIPYHEKNSNWQNQYCLSITNKNIHDSLIKHGMIPNKSLSLTFPNNLKEEYYPSFILGYLDGDGSICKTENRVKLIGTESFCNSIAEIVKKVLGIHCSISLCHNNKEVTTRDLQIAGRNQVKKFLDWLYSSSDVFLNRKYQIYKDVYCSA